MSESKQPRSGGTERSTEQPAAGGLEKSTELDRQSNQGPGVHGAEVEKHIGRNMPDRK